MLVDLHCNFAALNNNLAYMSNLNIDYAVFRSSVNPSATSVLTDYFNPSSTSSIFSINNLKRNINTII
jgi:hypothetical protein